MKFLIAPNAYKGTLTALEASRYIQEQFAAFNAKDEEEFNDLPMEATEHVIYYVFPWESKELSAYR